MVVAAFTTSLALSVPAFAALDADKLSAAVTAANPFLRPLGATTLIGPNVGRSFGDPLPEALDDAGVRRLRLLGFGGYCGGSPLGEEVSIVVATSRSADGARGLVDRLMSDAADGGGALREASASGRFAKRATRVKLSSRRGYAVALTDNESEGFVRSGTVVVVRASREVVITTALCGEGGTPKARKAVAAETRGHAREITKSIVAGLEGKGA